MRPQHLRMCTLVVLPLAALRASAQPLASQKQAVFLCRAFVSNLARSATQHNTLHRAFLRMRSLHIADLPLTHLLGILPLEGGTLLALTHHRWSLPLLAALRWLIAKCSRTSKHFHDMEQSWVYFVIPSEPHLLTGISLRSFMLRTLRGTALLQHCLSRRALTVVPPLHAPPTISLS